MEDIVAIIRAVWGTRTARQMHKINLEQACSLDKGLNSLSKRLEKSENCFSEQPIFIFSAGWRSGSTLLQRLINSSEKVIIWGEAYDSCGIIQSLTKTVKPFTDTWPPESYLLQPKLLENLSESWTANLYPPLESLRDSYRALFITLYADSARRHGAKRWGFKEVRLGYEEAIFLKWLFPNGKFLFIYRDVNDAYQSYKNFHPTMSWYANWPSVPIFTPFPLLVTGQGYSSIFIKQFNLLEELYSSMKTLPKESLILIIFEIIVA